MHCPHLLIVQTVLLFLGLANRSLLHRHSCCLLMLVQSLFALFIKIVLGKDIIRIHNANEFIDFSKNVNNGNNYTGTTVLLDSDLSLPEINGPINNFLGAFDGQGHIINNLKMNSSSKHTGLFGYSTGLSIRNVVLGSSCTMTNSFRGSGSVYIGGIIGEYELNNRQCNIENSVNMADVTFSGAVSNGYDLYLGGVIGKIYFPSRPLCVKNCANYGSITHSGKVNSPYIGGIVGGLDSYYEKYYIYIHNCLNYGTITHNGTTTYSLYLGGIAGKSYFAHIENCVSAGKIITPTTRSNNIHIGSIVGDVYSDTHINHCYFTTDAVVSNVYKVGIPSKNPTFISTVNSSLITELNNYDTSNGWNKWFLNENNAPVTFKMNGFNASFLFSSKLIILPIFSGDWRSFIWFTNEAMTTPFSSLFVSGITTLYGRWDKYIVDFNANGGNASETSRKITYNSTYGKFPTPIKEGYMFVGWFTEKTGGSEVTPSTTFTSLFDVTLYAHWAINNYTIRFNFNNGTGDEVKVFEYNSSVVYPSDPTMEGYIFSRWEKSNIVQMPAQNITITAQWIPNNYTVAFNVNGGNASETPRNVTFNNTYGELPIPTKEGYMFVGWFTDSNESVKNDTVVSIADNHTLHAHWEKITNKVEIVFNTKNLTKEEVEEIVKKYTNANFTITEFEEESGDIKVIIKFTDNEAAANFVEVIKESSGVNNIKNIGFIPSNSSSVSSILCPILIYNIIIFIV